MPCIVILTVTVASIQYHAMHYMHSSNSLGTMHAVLHCLQHFPEVIFAHSPELMRYISSAAHTVWRETLASIKFGEPVIRMH